MYCVYGAYKNSQMTDGCGVMVLDVLFTRLRDASNYLRKQTGIMGRQPNFDFGEDWDVLGDWEIRSHVLVETIEKPGSDMYIDDYLARKEEGL